jgi:hypothetical protein
VRRDVRAALIDRDLGPADRPAGDGRDLSRQADETQGVAAVGLDVHVENHVAVQVGQVRAELRLRRQNEDALGVAGDTQLVARAEHALGGNAHLLGPLDAAVSRQHGSRQGNRHSLSGGDVVSAADDAQRLPGADVHGGQVQPVRPGVVLHGQQLAHDDVSPVRAPPLETLDFHAQQRQALRQLFGRELDIDVLAEPGKRDPHRNCSRKRRSFSR